jgi:hypothetical protein
MSSNLFCQIRNEHPQLSAGLDKLQDFFSQRRVADCFYESDFRALNIGFDESQSLIELLSSAKVISEEVKYLCPNKMCGAFLTFQEDDASCSECEQMYDLSELDPKKVFRQLIVPPITADKRRNPLSKEATFETESGKTLNGWFNNCQLNLSEQPSESKVKNLGVTYKIKFSAFSPAYGKTERAYIYDYEKEPPLSIGNNYGTIVNGNVERLNSDNIVINYGDRENVGQSLNVIKELIATNNIKDERLIGLLQKALEAKSSAGDVDFIKTLNAFVVTASSYSQVFGLSLLQIYQFISGGKSV